MRTRDRAFVFHRISVRLPIIGLDMRPNEFLEA